MGRDIRLRLERRRQSEKDPEELKMARREKHRKSLTKVKVMNLTKKKRKASMIGANMIVTSGNDSGSDDPGASTKRSTHESPSDKRCCSRRCTSAERIECQKRVTIRCRQKAREFMTS